MEEFKGLNLNLNLFLPDCSALIGCVPLTDDMSSLYKTFIRLIFRSIRLTSLLITVASLYNLCTTYLYTCVYVIGITSLLYNFLHGVAILLQSITDIFANTR